MTFFAHFIIFCVRISLSSFTSTHGATFEIRNNCPFTVWAAAVPGGGRQRQPRYNTSPHLGSNQEHVECSRPRLAVPSLWHTLAEYALNQFNNLDFYDISLVHGFNVPMDFSPLSGTRCRGIRCAADINGQCPNELRAPGGCNNPCMVFKTDQYCCNSGKCGPTNFSMFFKQRCSDAYSYPKDDQTSTFTCPGGTNYSLQGHFLPLKQII